jgi:hypothetical protein
MDDDVQEAPDEKAGEERRDENDPGHDFGDSRSLAHTVRCLEIPEQSERLTKRKYPFTHLVRIRTICAFSFVIKLQLPRHAPVARSPYAPLPAGARFLSSASGFIASTLRGV